MIEMKLLVIDDDTGEQLTIALPHNSSNPPVDYSHELTIVDWTGEVCLGNYDDIEELNDTIQELNDVAPDLTLDMIDSIFSEVTAVKSLTDRAFISKIIDNDYMLEPVKMTKKQIGRLEEEAARYLALEMQIPFLKNMSKSRLKKMKNIQSKVDWELVWAIYFRMGFRVSEGEDAVYIINWESIRES
jgi:hypothetical protein